MTPRVDDLLLHYVGDLSEQIGRFGPLAVFILLILPLGEEVVLIPAGMLIGHGSLPFVATWALAYVGVLFSDAVWFFIARYYGTPLLHKRWFKRVAHPRRLLQAKHQIERRGAWFVMTARFIPGSRTAAIIMAGMLQMPTWKYFLAESSLVILTVFLQLGLGYLIARGIGTESSARLILGLVAVVVLIGASGMVARWIHAHRKAGGPAPRAHSSWLRRFRRPRGPAPRPASLGVATDVTSVERK
jgi:membrane protein DedA with SNARE-associated domain